MHTVSPSNSSSSTMAQVTLAAAAATGTTTAQNSRMNNGSSKEPQQLSHGGRQVEQRQQQQQLQQHIHPELKDTIRVMLKKEKRYHELRSKVEQQHRHLIPPEFAFLRSFWMNWMSTTVDTLQLQPQLVYVAAYFLDVASAKLCASNLAKEPHTQLQHYYSIIALTAFTTAVKLHQPQRILLSSILQFSPVPVSVQQVVSMEPILFQSLNFSLHPPSPEEFCEQFAQLLPQSLRSHLVSQVQPWIRMAVLQNWQASPSVLAYACLLVVLEQKHLSSATAASPTIGWHAKRDFCQSMQSIGTMNRTTVGLSQTYRALRDRVIVKPKQPTRRAPPQQYQQQYRNCAPATTSSPTTTILHPQTQHIFHNADAAPVQHRGPVPSLQHHRTIRRQARYHRSEGHVRF